MNKSETISHKINKALKSLISDDRKLIVGIDGYAGSGKTTITKKLKELNKDIEIVHLDDFIKHWKVRKKLIESTKDKASIFEYNWYRYLDVLKLIRSFKKFRTGKTFHKIYDYQKNEFYRKLKHYDLSKKILVIDGIFFLHKEHKINELFDYRIYLDSEIKKSDQRRIKRDKAAYGNKFIDDNHPGNWISYYRQAYLEYIKNHKPQKHADMVFKI